MQNHGDIARIPASAFPSVGGEFGISIESISRICALDIEVTTFAGRHGSGMSMRLRKGAAIGAGEALRGLHS